MYLEVANKKVFCTTGGREFNPTLPTVIFVHGSGLSHVTWVLQTRFFAYNGYSVLALDLPGHGKSDGPALTSIADMAEWLSGFIDTAGLKEASLVGHSQGCLITMECAARYPNKVKSLGLVGGAAQIPMNKTLLEAAEKNDPLAFELMMSWAHGPSGHFGGHPVPGLSHIGVGRMLLKTGPEGTLAVDFNACDQYKTGLKTASMIKCPTINILGTLDKMTPVSEGKKLADAISLSELVTIPNCGHMVLLESAGETLFALKTFIRKYHKA